MKRTIQNLIVASAIYAAPVGFALADTYSQSHGAVQRYFQGGDEPSVKDAVWTAHDIFKVGMISNGSDRSGYASYVCEVLNDYGFKGSKVWVQVIDITKLVNQNDWVKMGEAHCQ